MSSGIITMVALFRLSPDAFSSLSFSWHGTGLWVRNSNGTNCYGCFRASGADANAPTAAWVVPRCFAGPGNRQEAILIPSIDELPRLYKL